MKWMRENGNERNEFENVLPITVMNQATVYEVLPIHTMHITKDTGYHLMCFLQSGIVT